MTSFRLAIVVAAILPTGCASVAVEHAKDLSSAGIQYAHATASVIDVASKTPYVKGDIDANWVDNRRTYLRVRALGQTEAAVNSAQAAAKQMQIVWERILSGEYSAKELTSMLKDTEDLLEAVNVLKDANKAK